jgi:hypothetical protein
MVPVVDKYYKIGMSTIVSYSQVAGYNRKEYAVGAYELLD